MFVVLLDELVQRPTLHVVQENEKTVLILVNFLAINQVLAIDGGEEGAFTSNTLPFKVAGAFSTGLHDEDLAVFLAHNFVYEAFFIFVDQLKGCIGVLRVFSLEFSVS